MQSHGPKRVYTPQSLEFWFGRLEEDWAVHFSSAQIEEGRRLYRDGEVRELELTAQDAIIHRRVEKRDEYAVIEWANGVLHVRSSNTDQDVARSLAVAGLHEIEELVCDEISPLPKEGGLVSETLGASTSTRPLVPKAAPTTLREGMKSVGATRSVAPSTHNRTLVLSFKTLSEGLSFQAIWLDGEGKRTPALGQGAAGASQVGSSERSKLIGLAAYARKAHFTYNQKTGVYVLESVVEIPNFLKVTLPAWKKLFAVELDERSQNLLKGPRAIEIEAVAQRRNGGAGLDLRWIFKAGERLLTEDEITLITKKGTSPLILPDVGIVTLPTDRFESIRAWQKNVAETHADGVISPYLIFSLFSDARFKLSLSAELENWRKQVLAPTAAPAGLPEILRPYQRRGVEWLHHLCDVGCHGLLADEMGLGKTLQVISLLASRPVTDKPSVIICPASVVPVWREEIQRFCPHLVVDTLKAGHDFTSRNEPVIWLSSYTQLRKHRALLDSVEFGYAVLDEGQFIKNPDAKVTQACFALKAQHRLVLTGTPLENRQLDLWSIFRFLLPGLLGSRSTFETALSSDRGATLERLRAQLAPFILRRTKGEVATELPPKMEMELLCPLTDTQRTEYARICSEGLVRLGNDVEAAMREKSFGFLALLTRLRQVCCDPDMLPWLKAPLTESGKISLLVEKLAEVVSSGHKVVIFSQFVMLLDRVKEALVQNYPDLPRFELTGMTLDRQKPVQAFQSAPGAAAMLVSLKAAGTGITLHAADYVFLLDPWWNPAVEAQAVDRVHRIGQKSTVFVYRMITAGTIEERIQALKASKKDLFDKLVGGLGGDFDLSQHFTSLQSLIQLTTQVENDINPS
ncbi:MAG: DEAD/DEAH box helicase [Opitutaceae bacterium]|nr:DEAD/DEAH box helicase [Opitutaceae bacterium]